jgi:hypothetical protein
MQKNYLIFNVFNHLNLSAFNDLDEMEQAEAVWSGVHIGDREDDEHKILLFQLDPFYVQVYFHTVYQVIRKFIAFSSTELLQPYLKQVDLVKRLNG